MFTGQQSPTTEGSEGCLDGVQIFLCETKAGGGTTTWKTADWYTVSAGTRFAKGV